MMSFYKFLKDNISLLIFNFSFLSFIIMLFLCLPKNFDKINIIIYIIIINFFMFSFYFSTIYLRKKKFINQLYKSIENKNFKSICDAKNTTEEYCYLNLIKTQDLLYEKELLNINNISKENEDLLLAWIHDIKIPISIINLIISENINLSFEPLLSDVKNQVQNIDDSLNKLLYLTRLNDFDKDFLISNVNIKSIVEQVLKKHSKYFISKKIKLKLINLDAFILTDEKWLFFMIDQLVSNSIKYLSFNGSLLIKCNITNDFLELVICDNGLGIKSEDLPRIFNKGFTGNNGRLNSKSTGIGLYLVKSLCDKLNYKIKVDSQDTFYTLISVSFPNLSN